MELGELAGRFDALAANLGGVFGRAFEVLGGELVSEAQGRAPARTGRLRAGIGTSWNASRHEFTFFTRRAPYAWAVERGKELTAKQKPYLVFHTGAGWRKVKSVRHPARPFMLPVFNERFYPGGEKNLEQVMRVLLEEAAHGLS
jgi:hypothetical protein